MIQVDVQMNLLSIIPDSNNAHVSVYTIAGLCTVFMCFIVCISVQTVAADQ